LFAPRVLLDCENFIEAKRLVTPVHIQPEWYFLPAYAILRSIPNKLGGVIALAMSVIIFYFLPFFLQQLKSKNFLRTYNFFRYWWIWAASVMILTFVGACPVEYPWIYIGMVFSFMYFSFVFFMLFCLVSLNKNVNLWC
jgi:ubiquinol-cytochrome c reductase cytochrome b subunit